MRRLRPLLPCLVLLSFLACKKGDPEPGLPILACRPTVIADSGGTTQYVVPYTRFEYDNRKRIVRVADPFNLIIWRIRYIGRWVYLQAYRNDGTPNPYYGTRDILLDQGRINTLFEEYIDIASPLGIARVRDTVSVLYNTDGQPSEVRKAGYARDSVNNRSLKTLQITNYTYAGGSLVRSVVRRGSDAQPLVLVQARNYHYGAASPAVEYFPEQREEWVLGIPFVPFLKVPDWRITWTYTLNGTVSRPDTTWYQAQVNERGFISHLTLRGYDVPTAGQPCAALDFQYDCR